MCTTHTKTLCKVHKWNKQKHAPLILLFQSKKRQQQHRGKSIIHKIYIQKYFAWQQYAECVQKCILWFAKSKQTWPHGACQHFGKVRVRNCQSIKFLWFFKTKYSTNQICVVSPLSYVCIRVCVKTLIRSVRIRKLTMSKILDTL